MFACVCVCFAVSKNAPNMSYLARISSAHVSVNRKCRCSRLFQLPILRIQIFTTFYRSRCVCVSVLCVYLLAGGCCTPSHETKRAQYTTEAKAEADDDDVEMRTRPRARPHQKSTTKWKRSTGRRAGSAGVGYRESDG